MTSLVQSLIQSGIISTDTVVTAKIGINNRWGGIQYKHKEYLFQSTDAASKELILKDLYSEDTITAASTSIVSIDGMTLARFADVCNVNVDGSIKPTQRKRGRKPKNRSAL